MSAEAAQVQSQMANPNAVEDQFQGLWDSGATEVPQAEAAPQAAPQPAQAEPQAEAAPQAEAEPEGPEYVDLDDYLAKAKVERDSFLKMPVTVKIDGETKAVPLSDVIKSYQLEGHVNNKSIELSQAKTAWETEQQQAKQALTQQLSQAQQLAQFAHQSVLAEYQGMDWNKLYAEDPARYAAESMRFQQRVGQIQGYMQQVQTEQQRLASEQQQQLSSKILPQERERMLDARPEWRNPQAFQAARQEMSSYAQARGIQPAELQSVFDHRYMLILHDAARYAQLQAQSPEAVKRVRTAPQVAQPGARQTRDPKTVAKQQALERFQKNPRDVDAQAAAFEAFG